MPKIFLMTGIQANETAFARGAMRALKKRLRGHDVTLIELPREAEKRRKAGITRSWENLSDGEASDAFRIAQEKGFDPRNPSHLLLEVHENPVNAHEAYPEFSEFYAKHVNPAMHESIAKGTFGAYYAAIHSSKDFDDIRRLKRKAISHLKKSAWGAYRIEVPVIHDVSGKNESRVDMKGTLAHFNVKNKSDAFARIADMVREHIEPVLNRMPQGK